MALKCRSTHRGHEVQSRLLHRQRSAPAQAVGARFAAKHRLTKQDHHAKRDGWAGAQRGVQTLLENLKADLAMHGDEPQISGRLPWGRINGSRLPTNGPTVR